MYVCVYYAILVTIFQTLIFTTKMFRIKVKQISTGYKSRYKKSPKKIIFRQKAQLTLTSVNDTTYFRFHTVVPDVKTHYIYTTIILWL